MSNRLGWIRSRCRAGEKILDIGSASGFTFRGTELEPHVTFVDLDLYDMPNFLQMDAHHLTLPDQAYDVAILGDILEHVDDPVQVIREARRRGSAHAPPSRRGVPRRRREAVAKTTND